MFFNRVVSSGGRVWFRVVLVVLMCFFSSVFVDGLYPKGLSATNSIKNSHR